MDSNTSWNSYLNSVQPRQIPPNKNPPHNNTDTPKYPSNERDGELMKRVLELEDVIKELKAQVAAETAPGHQIPQILREQNFHQPQISESSGVGLKRAVESDIANEEEPSRLKKKRRRLNYTKCTFCRKAKKKCSPDNRVWPGQKCDRCAEMGLDCSVGVTKKAGGEDRVAQAKQRKSSQEDQNHPGQDNSFFDWGLDLYAQPQYLDFPYPLLAGAHPMPISSVTGTVSFAPAPQMLSAPRQHDNQGHVRVVQSRPKPQCWEHGCNGRQFTTFSNLLRHQREESGHSKKASCPDCGAEFTRAKIRNKIFLRHLLACKQKRQRLSSSSTTS